MTKPFNSLSPAEVERLSLLAEELGEAVQAVGKILRHGYENKSPHRLNGPTNRRSLERELGDVEYAISLLAHAGDVEAENIDKDRTLKGVRVQKYLYHQVDQLILPPEPGKGRLRGPRRSIKVVRTEARE